jgi:D-lactate dehydrogenase
MKAIFYEVKDWERLYLQERLKDWTLHFEAGTPEASPAANAATAECLSVFIYSPLKENVLAKFPSLRMIATRSTGFDHIDLSVCHRRGISVSNVPSYGENTVAEHTFALILMLSRKVHQSYNQVRAGHLERAMLTGFDLQGKTLGIVGAGRIGLHAIRIGRGFGMRVLTYDVRRDPFLADLLGFSYASLDTLLAESDIVSLHCPLLPSTHHIVGPGQIARMKDGALLINTARGGLVDTDALIEALDSGRLAGAGLDVVEGEELVKEEKQLLQEPHTLEEFRAATRNRILLARDDVVFTPHNAFNSREALERILDTTIANLEAFRAGAPINLVATPAS